MGVPNPPLPRRDDPGDMDTAPLCSIGVSSWSDRGAEAAFDMIASGPSGHDGWWPSTRGMRLATSSPPAKRRPSRGRSGAAFGHRLRDRRRISPVVAFGSIWRGLWSGAQCLCQVNECSSGVHASHASYSITNWPHNTRKKRRAIDRAASVLGAAVLHVDHELTIIMFCIHC